LEPVIHHDKTLILEDGIELKSRIWSPKTNGPWPTLLMRQPYGREIASTLTYVHPSWFAQHGFLVVIQDVRGQGGSSGDFSGFSQEASDTTQTLNWVRSLPECNGKLGTYGFSYQGLTQLLATPESIPPDCFVPAMTGLDEGNHWSCEGGAFWWHIGLAWGLQLAAQRAKRNQNINGWIEIRESLENGSYLRRGPELLKKYDPQGMAIKWLNASHQCKKDWTIHKPLKSWLKKPILLIGGWWDPHLRGLIDIYHQSLSAGGSPEIHIGPASHLEWWEGTHLLHLNFFNRYLKNSKDLDFDSPKNYLWNLTSNNWEKYKNNYSELPYWGLKSNGASCVEGLDGELSSNTNGSGTAIIVHDPWRPAPAIGGHLSPNPGTADRSIIDKRLDIATFTTPPFDKSFTLEGCPSLELEAFSDQKGFDLCIALSITNEDLTKISQLSTGTLRVLGEDARKPLIRRVEFFPLLADFKKGTRLRISIAGAAWPAIGINPGNNDHMCQAPTPNCLVTTISLKLNESKLQISPLIRS
tara:strand:- start:5588 stop:7165 length:1578 start_codon:yes stop_codon:yes gene_type:complete